MPIAGTAATPAGAAVIALPRPGAADAADAARKT